MPTHQLAYALTYFDLSHLSCAELPYVTVLTRLMNQLATERMTAGELDSYVCANLGFLSFTPEVATQPNWKLANPRLLVSAGELATERMTAGELDSYVCANLGFLSFTTEVATQPNWKLANPRLLVSAGAISEKMDALARIPREHPARCLVRNGL